MLLCHTNGVPCVSTPLHSAHEIASVCVLLRPCINPAARFSVTEKIAQAPVECGLVPPLRLDLMHTPWCWHRCHPINGATNNNKKENEGKGDDCCAEERGCNWLLPMGPCGHAETDIYTYTCTGICYPFVFLSLSVCIATCD
ncbi:hypothetical protein DQ04_01471090 [Trypanosoma grayi]|uniref:hypothetical protein n=1 Tax=Trypanosoma grayi TaxID=71804 RepID=UPI0004F49F49|nr:hypothetical protein DQ04_01471090 [Trypanosoma grayi]KEG12723.1 hypothetical protein DQ04_01471090 [Trypanosoma grayi]